MQIQYVGFQLKAHGRDYTYRVIDKQAEDREFIFSISNRAFSGKAITLSGRCRALLSEAAKGPRSRDRRKALYRGAPLCLTRNSTSTASHAAPRANAPGRKSAPSQTFELPPR